MTKEKKNKGTGAASAESIYINREISWLEFNRRVLMEADAPGTPLLEEAERGEFSPLSEREMLEELKTFLEQLTCDCTLITHHTVSGWNLTGPDFLKRKDGILAALEEEIAHGDMDALAAVRRSKRTL